MKILRAHVENYGPFKGKHTFKYADQGLTMVLGDNQDEPRMNSNGSGKTHLFDALDWGLFGVVPRGASIDSVITDGEPSGGVAVELDDGGVSLVVERLKTRGKSGTLLVWRDGTPVTALDTKQLQSDLERILGLSRDVFHAAVLYAQTDHYDFASATDSRRMEILTEVLGLEDIDVFAAKVKTLVADGEKEHLAAEMGVSTATALLDAKVAEHTRAVEQQRTWQSTHDERVATAAHHHSLVAAKIEQHPDPTGAKLQELTAGRTARLTRLERWVSPVPDPSARALQTQVNKLEADRLSITSRGKAVVAKRDVMLATKVGDCSACGQPITQEHIQMECAQLDAEGQQLREEYTSVQQEQAGVQAQLDALSAQYHAALQADGVERSKVSTEISNIDAAIANLQAANSRISAQAANVEDALHKWRTVEAETSSWYEISAKTSTEVDAQKVVQHAAQTRLDGAARRLELLLFWRKAFGPAGLKNYILDSRLQTLNDAANHWVKLLTGGTFWVRIESQTQGRSTGKMSNKINLRVFRYNPDGTVTEREFKTWSGGEGKRIAWAVDFGLSRLIASRATKAYDLLVLDEVFKYVDDAGGEAVVEMLRALQREKTSIFVVEHSAEFQAQFERRILVRRKNACSEVVHEPQAA